MDEEIQLINENTKKEKIKNFLLNNKKKIILLISSAIILLLLFFLYSDFKKEKQLKLATEFKKLTLAYKLDNNLKIDNDLIIIINKKDPTYSPLALNFIIDNKLINDNAKINKLFDIIINEINLEKEIKNLIIYKKALFNSDLISENELLKILNPLLNTDSIWKAHALNLMGEYFLSKNEKQKAKDFFNQLVNLENTNINLKTEAQKKLNRELSD